MAWKPQEGCKELALAQPCSLAGPDAGSRPWGCGQGQAQGHQPCLYPCCLALPGPSGPSRRFPVEAADAACWRPCLTPRAGGSMSERRVRGAKARPRQGKPSPGCPSASAPVLAHHLPIYSGICVNMLCIAKPTSNLLFSHLRHHPPPSVSFPVTSLFCDNHHKGCVFQAG